MTTTLTALSEKLTVNQYIFDSRVEHQGRVLKTLSIDTETITARLVYPARENLLQERAGQEIVVPAADLTGSTAIYRNASGSPVLGGALPPTSVDEPVSVGDHFLTDVAHHEMKVLLDSGVYRHLRFRAPGTGASWFEVLTTPGQLTIRGDMGTYTFARHGTTDMAKFFHGNPNLPYWSEKLESYDRQCHYQEYSEDMVKDWVAEDFADRKDEYADDEAAAIWSDIEDDVLGHVEMGEERIYEALNDFESHDFEYYDVGEVSFRRFTTQFVWCCHAIVWGLELYRAHAAQPVPEAVSA